MHACSSDLFAIDATTTALETTPVTKLGQCHAAEVAKGGCCGTLRYVVLPHIAMPRRGQEALLDITLAVVKRPPT